MNLCTYVTVAVCEDCLDEVVHQLLGADDLNTAPVEAAALVALVMPEEVRTEEARAGDGRRAVLHDETLRVSIPKSLVFRFDVFRFISI